MMKILFFRFVTSLGIVVLLLSAYLSWQNDLLVVKLAKQTTVDVVREFDVNAFPILIVEPLKLLLTKASSQASVDNSRMIELLNDYLARRPFDAGAWLIASQFYQRVGEADLASQALEVAYSLSETNTPILLKVFNRYLELGLINQALPVAHDIVYARPHEFRRLFYLMGRLSDDYSLVVDKMIPRELPVVRGSREPINADVYFNWALVDAMRANNTGLARVIWKAMPIEFKRHTELGVRYINYLVELQKTTLLESVWLDVVGRKMRPAELLNSSDLSLPSPCWKVTHVEGVDLVVGSSADLPSLQLTFLGERNIGYRHLSCIVQVEPGSKYLLKGRSKGEDITTLSGPFLDVFYPSVKSSYRKTDAMIGSWYWTNFELILNVPEEAHFAKIQIRRVKTELLDSKISGRVWFENIELEQL